MYMSVGYVGKRKDRPRDVVVGRLVGLPGLQIVAVNLTVRAQSERIIPKVQRVRWSVEDNFNVLATPQSRESKSRYKLRKCDVHHHFLLPLVRPVLPVPRLLRQRH